jgi:uncharacterized protein
VNKLGRTFRINVGFLINQPIGYNRDIPFELDQYTFDESFSVRDLNGNLSISRTQSGLRVQGDFTALTTTECGRCLEDFELTLDSHFEEIFTYETNPLSEDELIIPEDGNIDFEPYIHDYLLLEMPINPVCKPDCLGLCDICGENRNLRDCGHVHEEPMTAMARELMKTVEGDHYPGKNTPITE